MPTPAPVVNQSSANSQNGLVVVLCVLTAIGILGTGWFYYKYNKLNQNPTLVNNADALEEVKQTVDEVAKLMDLPADETPTVATVLDKEKVKDQPFFVHAANGDKLLAYTKAKKAILYRPSQHRIIEVAPIVINEPATPVPAEKK